MIVATITLKLHDDGAMAISGNIGDVRCALGMIDAARSAVESKLGKPTSLEPQGAGILVPNYDVPVTPNEKVFPLVYRNE
jgi:hypothetical protein